MNTCQRNVAMAAGVGLAAVLWTTSTRPALAQGNGATKLNCDSAPCDDVARGRAAFNDRNLNELGGNGRACADCHMPSDSFQLSPAVARARFDALLAKLRAQQERGRSALPAGRRRRLPRERGQRERLLEPGGKRARARDDAVASERQGHRSSDRSALGRTPRSISGARSCPCSTSRSPDRISSCRSGLRRRSSASPSSARTPTARTGRAVTSTMRASARCRNRPAARSSRTRK